jgi:hypothetical protein
MTYWFLDPTSIGHAAVHIVPPGIGCIESKIMIFVRITEYI